jgi:hypothetical protein
MEYDEFIGEKRSIKPHPLLIYRTKEENALLKEAEDGEGPKNTED